MSNDKDIITCPNDGCNEVFNNRTGKFRHLKSGKCKGVPLEPTDIKSLFNKKDDEKYECLKCLKIISHVTNLKRHLSICGKKKVQHICNTCNKEFARATHLKQHERIHTKTRFSCDLCERTFKRKDHLEKHTCTFEKFDTIDGDTYLTFVDVLGRFDNRNVEEDERLDIVVNENANVEVERLEDTVDASADENVNVEDARLEDSVDASADENVNVEDARSEDSVDASAANENVNVEDARLEDTVDASVVNENVDVEDARLEDTVDASAVNENANVEDARLEDTGEENDSIDFESTPVKIKERRIKDTIRQMKNRKIKKLNMDLSDVDMSERRNILDKLLEKNDDDDVKYNKIYKSSVAKYFRRMITYVRYEGTENQRVALELLKSMFGGHLNEASFRKWLSTKIEVDEKELSAFLDSEVVVNRGGRQIMSKELRKDIYLFWLEHCEVSVQRSNSRHIVRITPGNVRSQIADLVDDDTNVSKKETKRGEKYHSNRYVTNKNYREIHVLWMHERQTTLSYGTFFNLKPFYVTSPTEKEMEMCLCAKCLNPHTVYKAIRRAVEKDLPKSLSDYLCKNFICDKEVLIDCHAVKCIKGSCGDCKIVNLANDLRSIDLKKEVSYYVFEKILTHYFNINGVKVDYKRTGRVDKTATLEELLMIMQDMAKDYLLHRYYVNNDIYYWKKFLESSKYYVVWMDYSQNIQFKEKRQVQSAHYSGIQHTLHDIVLISPGNTGNQFVYHLSDDTNHDSILTFAILDDVIAKYPYIINDGVLVIRSDNCQNQYKCCNTFPKMMKLAKEHKIVVAWFYGEAGHGRGIVDAMSSFGCKQPLKSAILNNDEWFMKAEDMSIWLTNHFKDDATKDYHLIDAEFTAKNRIHDDKVTLPINGSRSFHVICVDPQGRWTTVKYLQDIDIIEKVKRNSFTSDICDKDDIDNVKEDDKVEDSRLSYETIYELTNPGTFIGIRKEGNGNEDFYLAEVINKDIASEYVEDERGHTVAKGDMYVEVSYLEKQDERKRKVIYKRAKDSRTSFVGMNVIFVTNVEVSDDLKVDMMEYSAILRES